MRAARLATLVVACGLAATMAGGTAAMSTAKHPIKGKVFVSFSPGEGIANGQWIPSSTLPSQAVLETTMKAILARLP